MNNKRNKGIELLRIVLMLMICTQHILEYGGVLTSNLSNVNYIISNGIYQFSLCAVDGYGLISGYVSLNRKRKYKSIVSLWFTALFYSVFVCFIFFLISNLINTNISININDLIKSFFPVCFGNWYFRAYFLLFFLMPFVDDFIQKLDESSSKKILSLFFVFSFISLFTNEWFNNGYSVMWLLYLYIIGALINKSKFLSNINSIYLIAFYFIFLVINCLLIRMGLFNFGTYTSPSILAMAILLLVTFSKLKYDNKMVDFISPCTFGIYLLHDNQYIRTYLIDNVLAKIGLLNPIIFILIIMFSIAITFTISLIIDKSRLVIFKNVNIGVIILKVSAILEKYFYYE